MTEHDDDQIDALLRQHFEGPVPAGDFPDMVMERLPARRQRSGMPIVAGACAGLLAGCISLWSAPVVQAAWLDWRSGNISPATLALLAATLGMALLAMAWSIAESGEHSVHRSGISGQG